MVIQLLSLSLLAVVYLSAPVANAEEPSLSENIVTLYEADNCKGVEDQYYKTRFYIYSPLVRAVIASCLSNSKESAALFESGEKERPNNQVILILHARSLRGINPDGAMELWRKVRLFARSETIRRMADDFLSGAVDIGTEEERLSIGKKTTGWVFVQAGAAHTSNPSGETLGSSTSPEGSWGNNFVIRSRVKNETTWGDYGGQLSLAGASYLANHYNDNFTGRLDFPVGLDTGDYGSVVFTPFGAHELQGYSSYHTSWGMGVMGIALGSDYRQSVQAIIYRDHFYDPTTQTQAGDHYRFEYDWLFYPEGKEVSFGAFIEHVHAAVDNEDSDQSSVNFSHNDLGVYGTLIAKFRLFEFGVGPLISLRQDTNDSTYQINGAKTIKRRHDLSIDMRMHFGFPLERNSKMEVFYDYSQVFSNFGAVDVQNYNTLNRIFGINVDLQMDWL